MTPWRSRRLTRAALLPAALLLARPSQGEEAEQPRWQVFGLPVYATVPNEGNTYGVMPILLHLAGDCGIRSILAPSVSWNDAVHVTGTFRYYRNLSPVTSWNVIASASTVVNRSFTFEYLDRQRQPGRLATHVFLQARRSLFYRYFGLGPQSRAEDESSHVRTYTLATSGVHYQLPHHLAVGVVAEAHRDWLGRSRAFAHLPSLQDRFPDAPGLQGAGFIAAGPSVRFDTRQGAEYGARGVAAELSALHAHGLRGFDRFTRVAFDARALVPETPWLQGAGRLLVSYVAGGDRLPFYYLSSLGGELELRGFTEDRFIDRGAWAVDLEQRFRFLRTRWFGVTTDWRVDPFVSAGQVFGGEGDPFGHARLAVGVGFRAFVAPNVLGRVDLAWAGEGMKAYVLLGYPF